MILFASSSCQFTLHNRKSTFFILKKFAQVKQTWHSGMCRQRDIQRYRGGGQGRGQGAKEVGAAPPWTSSSSPTLDQGERCRQRRGGRCVARTRDTAASRRAVSNSRVASLLEAKKPLWWNSQHKAGEKVSQFSFQLPLLVTGRASSA